MHLSWDWEFGRTAEQEFKGFESIFEQKVILNWEKNAFAKAKARARARARAWAV